MRKVRRECYRGYRQQANLKNKNRIVARKDLSTDDANSALVLIALIFSLMVVWFFIKIVMMF